MIYNSIKAILLCLITMYYSVAFAQVQYKMASPASLNYGLSLKAAITIESKAILIRMATDAGVGIKALSFLYPTYHLQLQLYNGGIGTCLKRPRIWPLTFDMTHSATLTAGFTRPYRRMENKAYIQRNSPLYHFSDFSFPALQNPYNYSFSLGTNLTQAFSPHRGKFQRTGFVDIHVSAVQVAYSNDGTPFGKFLADGRDRHYTGDGFVAVNLPRKAEINQFIISYHKFTGYYKDAFEVANDLFLANVDYKDTIQQYFNRSVYQFCVASTTQGFGISVDLKNRYFKDVQHLIHRNDYWVLHQVPYPYRVSITPYYFSANTQVIPAK